jgi:hypothetical protein
MLPETAADAVEKYYAGEILEAAPIVRAGNLAEQMIAWKQVFVILMLAGQQGVHATKMSYLQFESWCFANKLAVPPTPAELAFCNSVKATAYSILREGFSNFVSRHLPVETRIKIRKQS